VSWTWLLHGKLPWDADMRVPVQRAASAPSGSASVQRQRRRAAAARAASRQRRWPRSIQWQLTANSAGSGFLQRPVPARNYRTSTNLP